MSTKIYTLTEQEAYTLDQPIAISESDVGVLVGPGGAVGGESTIAAAPGSTVTSHVTLTGLQKGDVRELLAPIFAGASEEREALTGIASELIAGQAAAGRRQSGIIEATKAPEQAQLKSLIPVLIVVVVVIFVWRLG